MSVLVKICGVKTTQAIDAAVEGGAHYLGFMFVEQSPRYVSPLIASELSLRLPTSVKTVGVFVNPEKDFLDHVLYHVPLNMIQLHGDETLDFIKKIKQDHTIGIIKAISISSKEDLEKIDLYKDHVDMILLDAQSGGSGENFDWSLLKDKDWQGVRWMLAGGLRLENINQAIDVTQASMIDLSSALESEHGVKDPEKIKEFLEKVKELR